MSVLPQKNQVNLVEFQKRLNLDLEDANQKGELSSLIGFKAHGRHWLIELGDLREIDGVPQADGIRRVAITKPWVMGISNFKGYIYTLVDFQMFLGGEHSALGINARALLLNQKFLIQTALIVPDVMGLVIKNDLKPSEPQGGSFGSPWSVAAYEGRDGIIWEMLNLLALSESDEMLNIEI